MTTITYATDAQVLERYALADDLLFPVDKPITGHTFDRHRIIVKAEIDATLDQRRPPCYGLHNEQFEHLECLGVLAMAFRENASTPSDLTDLYMAQAKECRRQFETLLSNVRAPVAAEDADDDMDEGNSIPFERC